VDDPKGGEENVENDRVVMHNLQADYHAVTAGELYHVAMHKYCALLTWQVTPRAVRDFTAVSPLANQF
jgi:hypothetical protein